MPSRTALITGASGGIGRALAHQFADHGYDLILVARRVDALEIVAREVRAGTVHRIPVDLSQPHSAAALVDRLSAAARLDKRKAKPNSHQLLEAPTIYGRKLT